MGPRRRFEKKTIFCTHEKNSDGGFLKGLFVLTLIVSFISLFVCSDVQTENISDHEKAIKAVNEGEILPLNEILKKITENFYGRVISINLKDSEKGLFGWVYDIMIIDNDNNVKQLRVDAGTSTVLSVISGEDN